MDSDAALRARAISASRSAMRYWSTGAIFVYVVPASCAIARYTVPSTTSSANPLIAIALIFLCIVFLLRTRWNGARTVLVLPARSKAWATRPRIPRPQWPGCLLPFAGFLFRSRVEKKLAHLAGHIAGDGSLLRPCECLIH